jgi:hypothetical protein
MTAPVDIDAVQAVAVDIEGLQLWSRHLELRLRRRRCACHAASLIPPSAISSAKFMTSSPASESSRRSPGGCRYDGALALSARYRREGPH